jgi:adenylyl-sulfate kinase
LGDNNKGVTIWFTGLSGAGKSTIAEALRDELKKRGRFVEIMDGDEVRENLSKGLDFSKEGRDTNIRRIGFVCNLLSRNGVVAIGAAISPYREIRDEVRANTEHFMEVFMDCPLEVAEERDVKGLYKKARAGEIKNFTGVSDPYEPPLKPEVTLNSSTQTEEESLNMLLAAMEERGYL